MTAVFNYNLLSMTFKYYSVVFCILNLFTYYGWKIVIKDKFKLSFQFFHLNRPKAERTFCAPLGEVI